MSGLKHLVWNTVVLGKWNPAILTPKGIAGLIFDKTGDFPIEVRIPLDAIAPPRVQIEGLVVSANFERFTIDSEKGNWESLQKSKEYCLKAIEALPTTPLSAAGFNIRYELEEPAEKFLELLKPSLDDSISDNGLIIEKSETRRSLGWNEGDINIHIIKENDYKVLLNFERQSTDKTILKNWLNIPIEHVRTITKTIMCSVLKICREEEIND